jgi:hypothetical protein
MISNARGIEKLHSRNCISTAAMFCIEKISTAMINSKLIMDLILCMDGYLAASIPDSGAWFPENDVTAALDRQIMAGLVNGWRSIVNNSSAPRNSSLSASHQRGQNRRQQHLQNDPVFRQLDDLRSSCIFEGLAAWVSIGLA